MWSGPRAVSAVAVVDVSPPYPHLVVLIDDGPEGLQNDPGGERNVTIAREPTEIYLSRNVTYHAQTE